MCKKIIRFYYLNILKELRDRDIIKIIRRVRSCGKSTLIRLYQDYLIEDGVNQSHIIAINFEDYNYIDLLEPEVLHSFIQDMLVDDNMYYMFFDEIQNVKDFATVVNSLILKPNIDIYITGSNTCVLSARFIALMSGKYIEVKMFPLSFREYVQFSGDSRELKNQFINYLKFSSFPYVAVMEENEDRIYEYLEGIYSTIVLKDIIAHNNIVDTTMLEHVTRFIFDNIGCLLSTNKIRNIITGNGVKINVRTVEKYISALVGSNVLYQVKRYDIQEKRYLKTLHKYYMVDVGLRYMLLGSRYINTSHILENIVYLELIRRNYKVYVGTVGNNEVFFLLACCELKRSLFKPELASESSIKLS